MDHLQSKAIARTDGAPMKIEDKLKILVSFGPHFAFTGGTVDAVVHPEPGVYGIWVKEADQPRPTCVCIGTSSRDVQARLHRHLGESQVSGIGRMLQTGSDPRLGFLHPVSGDNVSEIASFLADQHQPLHRLFDDGH